MERSYLKQARGFTQNGKSKMLASFQTYHGILITVRSSVKARKCLLQNGCIFLWTERLFQELAKEHFGTQSQLGESGLVG